MNVVSDLSWKGKAKRNVEVKISEFNLNVMLKITLWRTRNF